MIAEYSNLLLTLAAVLFVLGLGILFGMPLLKKLGKKEPEVTRRWTDPSKRE
jgi:hypothetical protein